MSISDFLAAADVMIDFPASDKRQLLGELAHKAASVVDVPADQIISALLKREELGSTGTGNGIAIPHARIQAVAKPLCIAAKLKSPIDFDAIDSRPVDLVFVLLLPAGSESGQLGVLASVARKLRVPEALDQMRRARSAAELYSAIVG